MKRRSKVIPFNIGKVNAAKYMVGPFILLQPLPNIEQINVVRYMFDEQLDKR